MSKWGLIEIKAKMAQTKRELPVLLAKQAENYFTDTFKKGGLDTEKWKEVQRRIPGTPEYKYPKLRGLQRRTSPILVGAGYGARGGTLRRKVSRSTTNATWDKVRLMVDLPYAKAQNEGNAHLTARPFMKHTNELGKMQESKIKTTLDKIWG